VPTTPGGGDQNPPQATVVTVARLYAEAAALDRKPVELHGGQVVSVSRGAGGTGPIVAFLVRDPSSPLNLTVRPVDYPPGTFPDLRLGQTVSVFGIFNWPDLDSDGLVDPGEPVVIIRHGTPDKIVIEG
jgi:hypothetical protein